MPTEQVIVVLGADAEQLTPEVRGDRRDHRSERSVGEGVSTSLRGGLAAVASEARGVFIYPADMPLVTPEALRELAHRQQVSGRPAAMTEAGGVRGVPVFITRSLFPSLMIQEGDVGGAQYLRAHPEWSRPSTSTIPTSFATSTDPRTTASARARPGFRPRRRSPVVVLP